MSQAIGLIDIETDWATGSADFAAPCDDATLDGLFARLVAPTEVPVVDRFSPGNHPAPNTIIAANLDLLADGLAAATRQVLADLFLSHGRR